MNLINMKQFKIHFVLLAQKCSSLNAAELESIWKDGLAWTDI